MKNIFRWATYLLLCSFLTPLYVGCNSSEIEENNNQATLNSLSLGLLSQDRVVKGSKGQDSVVSLNFAANNYLLKIDTVLRTIENVDSLPYGTNLRKVQFLKINAVGQVVLKEGKTGVDSSITLNTNIDFSHPRTLSVYPQGFPKSTKRKEYTMRLIVHQQDGDSVHWTALSMEQFRALNVPTISPEMIVAKSAYYKLEKGRIYSSPDQSTWTIDSIETNHANKLPTTEVSGTALLARKNKQIEELYFYGVQTKEQGRVARLWKRIVNLQGQYIEPWYLVDSTTVSAYNLPILHNAHLLEYDNGLLLVGIDSEQKLVLRFSSDRGRTWHKRQQLIPPHDFTALRSLNVYVLDQQQLYIVVNENVVWRGRLNRLGWK